MKKRALLETETLGQWAYLAVEKYFKKIIKYEDDFLQDRDPEAVHQMRVGMRSLRSVVTSFAPALDLSKDDSDQKIAKVAHRLGELRDLDVLKEELKTRYKPALPESEQKSLDTVFECLNKQRIKKLRKAHSSKSAQQYDQMKQIFQKWLKHPSYTELAQLPIHEVLPDLLLPSVSKLFLHPGWLVRNADKSVSPPAKIQETSGKHSSDPVAIEQMLATQGPVLHSLRKQTKRVRYQLELFGNFYGETYGEYLNHLKEIQSALGQIQDNVVLVEFMSEVFDSDIETCLPKLAEQLAKNNYQAWQDWQPLQQHYLDYHTRQAFHLALLSPSPAIVDK